MEDELNIVLPIDGEPTPESTTIKVDAPVNSITDTTKPIEGTEPVKEEEVATDVSNIDIDGVVYTLDESGNALDEAGNIKFTKESIDELSAPESDESDADYVGEIIKRVNIPISDEAGKPITYENSVDGISKYIADVTERVKAEVSSNFVGDFFSKYPGLEEAFYYAKANNGRLEGFQPSPDYSEISLSANDLEQHKTLIYTERISKGDSKAQAERAVRISLSEKTTQEDAAEALKFLKVKSDLNKQERRNLEKQAELEEQEVAIQYKTKVVSTLKEGKLNLNGEEIIIPKVLRVKRDGKISEKTISDFERYIFEPKKMKVGEQEVTLTQNQLDLYLEQSKKTHNNDVYEALRRFLNYDDSQLIKGAVAASRANEIKKLVTTQKAKKVTSVPSSGGRIKLPIL